MKNSKIFVLSVGGSLISTKDGVNVKFLKGLKSFIEARVKKGERFVLTCGGGRVCREYQNALKEVRKASSVDLDWMGIAATRYNASLVRLMFKEIAYPEVVNKPDTKHPFKQKVMAVCGNVPGHSSDNDAVHIANTYEAGTVINLTNVDKVYTADPNVDKDAKPIDSITWKEYLKMFGGEWVPGANYPFDPVASKFAHKKDLRVVIALGSDFKNLGKILDGKKFIGTEIQN